MILLAFGAGLAFNPLLLAAMGDVSPEQSGLASGLVNTTQMMGGALGLAILASLAAARTTRSDSGTAPRRAERRLPRGVPRRRRVRHRRPRPGRGAHAGEDARDARARRAGGRGRRARLIGRAGLRQRHELPEECARRWRVEPVVDVRRAARRVAGDRRGGDDVRLGRSGAEEVRAARVAVAGAAVPGRRILRDPQPARG